MKSIWKGNISFGLVTIPVELYSAIQSHSLGFKMLHEKCHTPISLKRWCSHCDEEVPLENIVKGIKLPDGSYFIMTTENIKKLKPQKSENIDIIEFVDAQQILPIYLDQHYYMLPKGKNDKAYFLFIEALKNMNKIAIGQFVMKDKQYACAIQPYKTGILLTTLNYGYEIRQFEAIETLEAPKINPAELKLAEQLIKALSIKKFNIEKFKDEFAQKLMARIAKVAKGIELPQKEKAIKIKEEPSIIEALKASLKVDHHVHK